MLINQIVLNIRGCISILDRDNILDMDKEFIKLQINRANNLMDEYKSFVCPQDSIIERLWVRSGEDDFYYLCGVVEKVKNILSI